MYIMIQKYKKHYKGTKTFYSQYLDSIQYKIKNKKSEQL